MSSREGIRAKSLKFLVVGSINTAATYTLYVALILVGLHHNLALTLEYAAGILVGYLMNRGWTFADHRSTRRRFLRYCATYGLVYGINLVLLNLMIGYGIAGPILGQLVALGAATVISFLLQNFWVFRQQPAGDF